MKLKDIRAHFIDRADWIGPDRTKTVDNIIAGDPEKDVHTCLVTWISSFDAVRAAVAEGVDLLITHEPTYYVHTHDPEVDLQPKTGHGNAKRRFIEENKLAILRLHDTWDRWPEIGIPWAWAQFLGFKDKPVAVNGEPWAGGLHRYDIRPVTVANFARRMAARTATIGEPKVQVTGNLDQIVSKIGVGTGCGCSIDTFRQLGCDLSIVCDDGSCYWCGIQQAEDDGHPVIRVNHGTSEEPGMITLTDYINRALKGVKANHLPHGSTFTLVG